MTDLETHLQPGSWPGQTRRLFINMPLATT